MNDIAASTHRAPDDDAWLGDAGVPRSREDRVAEIVAAIALMFSLCIGLVIALLPVSAKAISDRPASSPMLFTAIETAPPEAWPARRHLRAADTPHAPGAGDQESSPSL